MCGTVRYEHPEEGLRMGSCKQEELRIYTGGKEKTKSQKKRKGKGKGKYLVWDGKLDLLLLSLLYH